MKKETLPEIVWPDIKGNEDPPVIEDGWVCGIGTIFWVSLPFQKETAGAMYEPHVRGPSRDTEREAIIAWNELWS